MIIQRYASVLDCSGLNSIIYLIVHFKNTQSSLYWAFQVLF